MKATADAVKTVAVYTLVTQICPQQVEATLFSWVMGAQFMGSIVAQVLGGRIPRTCPTVDGADILSIVAQASSRKQSGLRLPTTRAYGSCA